MPERQQAALKAARQRLSRSFSGNYRGDRPAQIHKAGDWFRELHGSGKDQREPSGAHESESTKAGVSFFLNHYGLGNVRKTRGARIKCDA